MGTLHDSAENLNNASKHLEYLLGSFPSSVTNNREVKVYVDTLIGTRQFVSDTLIPAVEKELSR